MLAFDIETTGLRIGEDRVTCACAYDPSAGVERGFNLARGPEEGDDAEEFFGLLDRADRLCAFNGVAFDVPFLQAQYGLCERRVRAWVDKLFDVYALSRRHLRRGFSLNALLGANGLECKTGKGSDAVALAREGRWDELLSYCMHDARQTHAVSSLPCILLPYQRRVGLLCTGQFVSLVGQGGRAEHY